MTLVGSTLGLPIKQKLLIRSRAVTPSKRAIPNPLNPPSWKQRSILPIAALSTLAKVTSIPRKILKVNHLSMLVYSCFSLRNSYISWKIRCKIL